MKRGKEILLLIRIVLLLCLIVSIGSCSRSINLSFEKYEVANLRGEKLYFYIAKKPNTESGNKLLVMIQGSGRWSIQRRFGLGAEASLFGFDILYLEKYAFDDKKLFRETDCRERRVEDIKFVINHVLNDIYKGKVNELAIVADSEGGIIAPEVALSIKEAAHLLILGMGGYSQSKEFEILFEKELNQREEWMFEKAGIYNRGQLMEKFEEIRNNPTVEKSWLGHTYKRWNSYLFYSPEEFMSQLKISTMFIIGENDKSVPVESVKYLMEKLKDRDNFRFHIISGVDHSFTNSKGNNKMPEIIKTIIIPWYKENRIK